MPTTDLLNNPTGPFNNMGVPGAKSFHLLAPGYGNLANLSLGLANPYFIRMASSPNATVLQDVVAQSPTFFTMWIGNNDILGYATGGAPAGSPFNGVSGTAYTEPAFFEYVYGGIMSTMAATGAQGVVANIPDVLSIPFFHTVAYNPVPLDAGTAAYVNSAYTAYNNGLAYAASVGLISAEEAAFRTISFEASETNPFVITDDELTDLSGFMIPSLRQTKPTDLVTLTTASVLGTLADPNNPASVLGVGVPLGDANVLTTAEQNVINTIVSQYNAIIASAVSQAGYAFLDAHTIFNNLIAGNYSELAVGDNQIGTNLVLGGGFSLDGVHMTSRGYALLANEMLKAIDAKYGSNFEASGSLVDLGDYPTNYSPLMQ
jgi:lysophospholipase L1-like esterase